MENMELTKETHVVVLRGGTMFYVDAQQAGIVRTLLENVGSSEAFINLGESIISKSAIDYVAPVAVIEETIHWKKGDWRCKLGHWHDRTEKTCKEMEDKKEKLVVIENTGEEVDIKEIMKDQAKKNKEDRKYERTDKGWTKKGV